MSRFVSISDAISDKRFADAFKTLTDNPPLPWQTRLFHRFVAGDIPPVCCIPTGLGKTSVVAVWLLAKLLKPDSVPTRLVYVVNRRTVVDQTTVEVEKLRANLKNLSTDVRRDVTTLGVSTLRGQFADNREWSADPTAPSVVVGTVDMIGSRLLFGGYGIGFKSRPLHAGFLGQDSLLVHDEAHLEPAFQKLLEGIVAEQEREDGEHSRPLRIMQMSATSRGDESAESVFKIDDQDRADRFIAKRLGATKTLKLLPIDDEKKLAEAIATAALDKKDSGRAVLIFVRNVDNVKKIVEQLQKKGLSDRVQTLTGEMRGRERDRMADPRKEKACPVFARFLPRPKDDAPPNEQWKVVPKEGAVYLVCTSAGEVGVNLSADELLCDLSTYESMAQRFGRVNRFGQTPDATITVFHPKSPQDKDEKHQTARRNTLGLLKRLNDSANPNALANLPPTDQQAGYAPPPGIVPTTDILFDAWAMTTIREELPGRPPLEDFLHGVEQETQHETHFAWRAEVERVASPEQLAKHPPQDLLDDYPLKPHELLRMPLYKAVKAAEELANRWAGEQREKSEADPSHKAVALNAWIVQPSGKVEVVSIAKLAEKDRNKEPVVRLAGHTVLLPPRAGGLALRGYLDSSVSFDANRGDDYDVADEWPTAERPLRLRVMGKDPATPKGMRTIRRIELGNLDDVMASDQSGEAPDHWWRWYESIARGDADGATQGGDAVPLDKHVADVVANIEWLIGRLDLPGNLKDVLRLAAKGHDLGKRRELWQRAIGNPDPTNWCGKSAKSWKSMPITDYRHEFGSLLDLEDEFKTELDALSKDDQDLVFHLIATHHGRARPHYPAGESSDPDHPTRATAPLASEIPRRFGRFQRRFGRWGLAWLESLLRAADYAASGGKILGQADTESDTASTTNMEKTT